MPRADYRRRTKPVDPFYKSPEWAEVRRVVLARDRGECSICGAPGPGLHVDHIVSRRRRPDLALDPRNLRALCHSCHSSKSARSDGGFGNQARPEHSGCNAEGDPIGEREHW